MDLNSFAAPNYFTILVISAALTVLPFLAVTTTSFAKISIVLFLIRNALGIQQTPPSILINTIAIMLTVYIMAPIFNDIYHVIVNPAQQYKTLDDWRHVFNLASEPLKHFLDTHVRPESREFFVDTTKKLWRGYDFKVSDDSFIIIMPAFLTSELTRAFEVGFLLYLPFLVVDFVISIILVAMGMQMMSPTVISTPFKLLLFVMVDGWSRLLQGLVLSYAPHQ